MLVMEVWGCEAGGGCPAPAPSGNAEREAQGNVKHCGLVEKDLELGVGVTLKPFRSFPAVLHL